MNTRITSPVVVVPASGPHPWCQHPPEEHQRLYSQALEVLPDRLLCGLCGEMLFVRPLPPAA